MHKSNRRESESRKGNKLSELELRAGKPAATMVTNWFDVGSEYQTGTEWKEVCLYSINWWFIESPQALHKAGPHANRNYSSWTLGQEFPTTHLLYVDDTRASRSWQGPTQHITKDSRSQRHNTIFQLKQGDNNGNTMNRAFGSALSLQFSP
jgi:hypothetical protein